MSETGKTSKRIHAPLEQPVRVVIDPFVSFIKAQSASGWVLIVVTILAVMAANSALGAWYQDFLHLDFAIQLGDFRFERSVQHWVNEGFMSLFFFLLSLELKRELLVGQLSSGRRAGSVVCAAIGGITLPAALFLTTANNELVRAGWAIPVATDTAFALTVLVLLGSRVPTSVRAFLVGIAIVDDLAAILIIAFGYTKDLDLQWGMPVITTLISLFALNITGMRHGLAYFLIGIILWYQCLNLGLHGTLAGVMVAALAPVRPVLSREAFLSRIQKRVEGFRRRQFGSTESMLEDPEQQEIAAAIQQDTEQATPALNRWETRLEIPISFLVMPLFAFTNAGIILSPDALRALWASDLSTAVPIGLVFGKPIGIFLAVWLGKLVGLVELPSNMSLRHVFGIGMIAGIGFTMSIFIATLAFGEGTQRLEIAKQCIIFSSICAGILGYAWIFIACRKETYD
jgi:NhaA family Na+:H+ antiporter